MNKNKKTPSEEPAIKPQAAAADGQRSQRVLHEAEGGASGAVAGAAFGAIAGPPGIVAGAVIGGIAGALAGAAMDESSRTDAKHTRELDDEIGVTGEELGAPNLKHPPAKRGAYSAASIGSGGGSGSAEPAEGPMQDVDSE